jgi:hypothetical protein
MNERVRKILDLIEEARVAEDLGNDQARTASVALGLEGHDAMLACRLIAQGSDPASLDYLDTGEVDPKIMLAHREGPGIYESSADRWLRRDYLALCALSADESQGTGTMRERFWGFYEAMKRLTYEDEVFREAAMDRLGQVELSKIMALPYKWAKVGGVAMRVYTSDRGFAAAVWDEEDPQTVAAVLGIWNGEPYLAVGAPPYHQTLAEQGIKVDKVKTPRLGIIEDPDEVARVIKETELKVS